MPPPWTAAEAASDAVSKKMILAHLQENCSADFLSEHKLAGQPNAVLKRVTKDAMVEAYKVSIGEGGEGGAKKGGFTFAPPAAVKAGAEAAQAAFTFSPPDKAAGGGKPAMGNLFGAAPAAGGGGGFAFNFGAPSKGGDDDDDDDDDDDEDYPSKGGMNITKALQRRMEQLNMSAAQRRDQTVSELPPVRTAHRSLRRAAPRRRVP